MSYVSIVSVCNLPHLFHNTTYASQKHKIKFSLSILLLPALEELGHRIVSLLIHFSHCLYGLLMPSLSYSEDSLLIGRPSLPVHSETTSKRPPFLGELGWMFVELEVV